MPSKEEMVATAEEDMAEWTRRFKSDALRVKGKLADLVSSLLHCLLDRLLRMHMHMLCCTYPLLYNVYLPSH